MLNNFTVDHWVTENSRAAPMRATKSSDRFHNEIGGRISNRFAVGICIAGSSIGWVAIVGVVLLF